MYTICIAGSTLKTRQVAETLQQDSRFQITGILTPAPRKVGRKQETIINPLHQFALDHSIPVILVDSKIDISIQGQISQWQAPELLLVVDFGFFVPPWLLQWPTVAPLNIHPSLLPAWRGSSPGQSVLLAGEKRSAVTLMVMSEKMDEGPILAQIPFTVDPSWTQTEYYEHSFYLICEKLGTLLGEFLSGTLLPQPQPVQSPTPLAQKLTKQQAFREWETIDAALTTGEKAEELERACRAFYPWPKLWTEVKTAKGTKRMIIHRCSLTSEKQLQLEHVQLEGKSPQPWREIQNTVLKSE